MSARSYITRRLRRNREHAESQHGLWWLSFVDTTQVETDPARRVPGGKGFLGVILVHADGPLEAVERTIRLGINPGGEVGVLGPVRPSVGGEILAEYLDRLLDTDAIEGLNIVMTAAYERAQDEARERVPKDRRRW